MTDFMTTLIESKKATPSAKKLKNILKNKQKNIFKIKDIEWKPHSAGLGGERAIIEYDNGYGASVLFGGMFYTDNGTYEIAVLGKDGSITYDTPLTDDVFGYLTEEEAEKVLKDISELD